jgi:tetratricopeptide (TPR) repeat protein
MKPGTLRIVVLVAAIGLIVLLYSLPRQSSTKRMAVGSQEVELSSEISQAIDMVATGTNPMGGIQMLLTMVEEDSTNVEAHFWLGKFSVQSGQFEKAEVRFQTVTRLDPTNVDGWWELASSQFQQKRYAEALEGFIETRKLDATFDNALFFQGQCYQLMGDSSKAIETYQAFLPLVKDTVVVGWLHNTINELKD